MCRSKDSDSVHSVSRVQASSRENCGMAVTLAERSRNPAFGADESPTAPLVARTRATLAPPIPMEKFVIQGGVPLSGTIVPAGNKNGALPILAAALLTDDEVVVRNVPRIADVQAMLALLAELGARVEWTGENEVAIRADGVSDPEVDRELSERIRASFLLAGPLLARHGR